VCNAYSVNLQGKFSLVLICEVPDFYLILIVCLQVIRPAEESAASAATTVDLKSFASALRLPDLQAQVRIKFKDST